MFGMNVSVGQVNVGNIDCGHFSGVETPEVILDKDLMLVLCMSHNEIMLHNFFEMYLSYKISADSAEAFENWVRAQKMTGLYNQPRYYAANYKLWLEKTGKV